MVAPKPPSFKLTPEGGPVEPVRPALPRLFPAEGPLDPLAVSAKGPADGRTPRQPPGIVGESTDPFGEQ